MNNTQMNNTKTWDELKSLIQCGIGIGIGIIISIGSLLFESQIPIDLKLILSFIVATIMAVSTIYAISILKQCGV